MAPVAKPRPKQLSSTNGDEVLDLQAAKHLKLPEEALIEAVKRQRLPGRAIGGEWRFLKAAIQNWLSIPAAAGFWDRQARAFKDDPYLDQMVKEIYANRGRPMCE